MKIRMYPIFLLLFLFASSTQAQRRRETLDYNRVRDSIAAYNFQEAIDLLEEDIERRTKRRKPTEEAEALLSIAHRGMGKLMATERILIIDSVIVDKNDALNHIHLSSESGTLQYMSQLLQKPDSNDCTMFRNQLQNQAIYSQMGSDGHLSLFQSVLVGDEWTKPTPVKGIKDDDSAADINFPFMLSDGATLYYAAKSEEGLGGYDIYMTRYDADAQEFLAPENIGMPFNSEANDYLFAIDEYHNLGWFITDRRMLEGKVCVYTFVPNETRRIYNEAEVSLYQLRRLASIQSIRETWTNPKQVNEAQQRLKQLLVGKQNMRTKGQFTFVIDNQRTYYTLADFKNPEARKTAQDWIDKSKLLKNTSARLNALRDKYSTASSNQQQQMAPQIRLMESEREALVSEIQDLEKEMRVKEINTTK